jgi:hypothetical protein
VDKRSGEIAESAILSPMSWENWLDASGCLLGAQCPLPLDRPFTWQQAECWGANRRLLAGLVRVGLVRRVLHGVYAASQCPDSVLTRAQALHLVLTPQAVICDQTAAWLHGIEILKRGSHLVAPPLDVCKVVDSRVNRPGVAGKRRFTLLPRDIQELHGLRVTTPLRTALDLGRRLWRYDALAALDGALRIGVDHAELLDEVARFKGERGVVQLRTLAPKADGRAASAGESALRLRWDEAGLPKPEPQFEIRDDYGVLLYQLDVPLPDLRFAAEYDGEEFHTEPDDVQHDRERRADLELTHDWHVRGFTKHDVYNVGSDLDAQLRQMLHEARRRFRRWSP